MSICLWALWPPPYCIQAMQALAVVLSVQDDNNTYPNRKSICTESKSLNCKGQCIKFKGRKFVVSQIGWNIDFHFSSSNTGSKDDPWTIGNKLQYPFFLEYNADWIVVRMLCLWHGSPICKRMTRVYSIFPFGFVMSMVSLLHCSLSKESILCKCVQRKEKNTLVNCREP